MYLPNKTGYFKKVNQTFNLKTIMKRRVLYFKSF
jgi:hypothetical protein